MPCERKIVQSKSSIEVIQSDELGPRSLTCVFYHPICIKSNGLYYDLGSSLNVDQ